MHETELRHLNHQQRDQLLLELLTERQKSTSKQIATSPFGRSALCFVDEQLSSYIHEAVSEFSNEFTQRIECELEPIMTDAIWKLEDEIIDLVTDRVKPEVIGLLRRCTKELVQSLESTEEPEFLIQLQTLILNALSDSQLDDLPALTIDRLSNAVGDALHWHLNRHGFTGDCLVLLKRLYRVCSCLHRTPPQLLLA